MNENTLLWLNTLRSGEYEQDRGYLHTEDGYCCLGVACDLYKKVTNQGEWELVSYGSLARYVFKSSLQSSPFGLPNDVREWLGISTDIEEEGAKLNDHGVPFEQIADALEKELA